ncbi:MAG: adenosylmethionine-8-amino-7-oxononanoate aminotransferase [Chlamydiales bacterium]|jgi:adenosylmethionine-8-amino-7-oxononanoate aminotransferase
MTTLQRSLVERDRAHVWHPFTQHGSEPEPLAIAAASGSRLTLADGTELIDAVSSWWTCLHGHGHPELRAAAESQASQLDHTLFAGTTHEPAVELAERLVDMTPAGLSRVFFSDNGSTSVEVALKMVRQRWVQEGQPERMVFVSLTGGYHGDTFGAMAAGDPDPFFLPFQSMMFEVRRVAPEASALEAALAELGERACGVILEPLLQGAAGMRMHSPEFLRAARAACDAHGLPLIADEVLTGFGRTGTLFACDQAGISPDLMCLAKGLTSGMFPLAVTMAREDMFASFLSDDRSRAFFHGHTNTAHPIGCAVANASLRITIRDDVPARLTAIGKRIHAALQPLVEHPRVTNMRVLGGVVAFDIKTNASGYLQGDPYTLRRRAIERGVLLRPLGNVMYAMPPACTTDEECDQIAQVMIELVDD